MLKLLNLYFKLINNSKHGDWGLGIGYWAQSPIPNPQSPIPNPHFIIKILLIKIISKINLINYLK